MMTSRNGSFKSSRVRITAPYPLTRTLLIKSSEADVPLIDYLRARFSWISEEEWLTRIRNQWIWFGEGEALPARIVKGGEILYHHTPRVVEPSVPDQVRILREEPEWLALYKPAPMPMHQGGRYFKNTLIRVLDEMGHQNLSIVHRLDAVTSGVVLLAKNSAMANRIQSAFSAQRVTKHYFAVVEGEPEWDFRVVDLPIARKKAFVFEAGHHLASAKPAVTRIEKIRSGNGFSLVRCIPVTGRTHQIRLHLKEAGIPIIDDPIYGPLGDSSGSRLQNRAISLASSRISIPELDIELALNERELFPGFFEGRPAEGLPSQHVEV